MSNQNEKVKKAGCMVVGATVIAAVAYFLVFMATPINRESDDQASNVPAAAPTAQVRVSESSNVEPVPMRESAPADVAPAVTQPVTLTDANFIDEVLQTSKPVLVDFWAEWCQPCRAMAPVIEQLAHDFGDGAIVGKLDVEANPKVASALEVQTLPTLLIFKDGKVVDEIVGLVPAHDIAERLERFVDQPTT